MPEDRENQGVEIQQNFHLSSWFGITVTDTRTFPGVEYEKWAARVHFFLGELETGLPQDPAARKFISSWAAAMLERDWHSRALVFTWDLDARNPSCLLRADSGPDPRLPPSLDYRRAPERDFDPDNMGRWVLVKFHHDPDKLQASGWSLLTSAMGALLLARRLSEADTSRAALSTLVAVGVPVCTRILRTAAPHPSDSDSESGQRVSESNLGPLLGTAPRRHLPKVWRENGERANRQGLRHVLLARAGALIPAARARGVAQGRHRVAD